MTKTILIVGAIVLAIIILVPIAIFFGSDSRPHKLVVSLANAQKPVTAQVPRAVAQVRARLDQKINGGANLQNWVSIKHPEYGPQFAEFFVITNEKEGIDSQFRFTQTGMSSDAPISTSGVDLPTQDLGLPSYLKLPIPQRQHDLQIQPTSTWTTPDFSQNGQLLPYSSSYFLHFKAVKPNVTEITVLGYNATVIKGKRWSVLGDMFVAPPHRVDNVLSVPPSPADKQALLENILKLLK